jgi:hypothetical protein
MSMPYAGVSYKLDRMKMNYKFASLAGLLLMLGFGAGYLLNNEPIKLAQDPDLSLPVDPACVLNETACERNITTGGTIGFSIGPRPILGASPLTFNLSVDQLDVQSAAIELKGVSMNMGSYHFDLTPDGDGGFIAEGNLPVCVRNQMLWQADVWLKTRAQGLVKVSYLFTAYKS